MVKLLYFEWVDQRTLQCYIGQTALLDEVWPIYGNTAVPYESHDSYSTAVPATA